MMGKVKLSQKGKNSGSSFSLFTFMSLPNGSSLHGRLDIQDNIPSTMTQGAELSESPTSLRDVPIVSGHTSATAAGDIGNESGSNAGEESYEDESEESDDEEDVEVAHDSAEPPQTAQHEGHPPQSPDGHTDEGDAEDDDSNEEEEDSDDEGDEEPALKYERLGGPVNDLLQKDSASSLTIANKLMVSNCCILAVKLCLWSNRPGHGYSCRSCTCPGLEWQQDQVIQTSLRVYPRYLHGHDCGLYCNCLHRR